ncbi:dCTP deaminase [Thermogymnomonas acidicola]|uniref:dCTP deaminase n=1 Tax=Thermogymnomonas acidicola TaxID=399579 RepID=UPI001E63F818|nr:dCTP deaminase [Thermogymnomonas acidicola]
MISDGQIQEMARNGMIVIEGFREGNLTPNGYDLTVGSVKAGGREADEAEVAPMGHFLVSTLEYIYIPEGYCAEIWIRSSFARKGVIGSFGFIDSGFRGNLTLSFFNAGQESIRIRRGERVAQMVIIRMERPPDRAYGERSGNYQGSRGVVESRL